MQQDPTPKGPAQAPSFQVPGTVIAGMWSLVAFAIVAVVGWRIAAPPAQPREAHALAERYLTVTDGADGSVIMRDAADSSSLERLDPGTSGFIRATLRGLARERKRQGSGPEAAFRLVHWSDGHLTLDDLATGREIDLGAFGVTNAQAFARLMHSKERQP